MDIRPATAADARALAPELRPEDLAEVQACGYGSALEALERSLQTSALTWAMRLHGELAVLFGVVSRGTALGEAPAGVVWCLTGGAVTRHPRAYLRASRAVLPALLARWPLLYNLVDSRYTGALRWAKWLGAEVRPPAPLHPGGVPFHVVIFRR